MRYIVDHCSIHRLAELSTPVSLSLVLKNHTKFRPLRSLPCSTCWEVHTVYFSIPTVSFNCLLSYILSFQEVLILRTVCFPQTHIFVIVNKIKDMKDSFKNSSHPGFQRAHICLEISFLPHCSYNIVELILQIIISLTEMTLVKLNRSFFFQTSNHVDSTDAGGPYYRYLYSKRFYFTCANELRPVLAYLQQWFSNLTEL